MVVGDTVDTELISSLYHADAFATKLVKGFVWPNLAGKFGQSLLAKDFWFSMSNQNLCQAASLLWNPNINSLYIDVSNYTLPVCHKSVSIMYLYNTIHLILYKEDGTDSPATEALELQRGFLRMTCLLIQNLTSIVVPCHITFTLTPIIHNYHHYKSRPNTFNHKLCPLNTHTRTFFPTLHS